MGAACPPPGDGGNDAADAACTDDPQCATVGVQGSTCVNEGTSDLITCTREADGCLHLTANVKCGQRQQCTGSPGSAQCTCNTDAICTQAGDVCAPGGTTLVVCSKDQDGCFFQDTPQQCGPHQTCTGSGFNGACTCNADPTCPAAGGTCSGPSTLLTCSTDAQGCVYNAGSTTCGPNQTCSGSPGSANCQCNANPKCTIPGGVCQSSSSLVLCTQDQNGCFVDSVITCAGNQSCTGAAGTALCTCNANPACPAQGTNCESSSTVGTCSPDANGCLVETSTATCGPRQTCGGNAGVGKCTCNADPTCSTSGPTCKNATTIATCYADANGCFFDGGDSTCPGSQTCSGAPGAAVCKCVANPVCQQQGTVCESSTTVATCGLDPNQCLTVTSTSTCSGTATCVGSAPNAGCCTDACTAGTAECVSGQLATCAKQADGCFGYGSPSACPTHEVCSNAAAEEQWSAPGTYTFTVPSGVTSLSIQAFGGGGGGSGNYYWYGGGGGGYAGATVAVSGGQSFTVVVGSGGAAGDGAPGTQGGSSSVGNVVVAGGGGGAGVGSSSPGSAGGTGGAAGVGITGTTLLSGGAGGQGGTGTGWGGAGGGGGGGGAGSSSVGAQGGAGQSGSSNNGGTPGNGGANGSGNAGAGGMGGMYAGGPPPSGTRGPGHAGTGYGAGGGGGCGGGTAANGQAGYVIITWQSSSADAGADAGGTAVCTCVNDPNCTQAGNVCEGTGKVATCSADANGCLFVSSTATCTLPFQCQGTSPSAGCVKTCTDACSSGQKECVGAQIASCQVNPSTGCFVYGTASSCATHETCTGAVGSATCSCNNDPLCGGKTGAICDNGTTAGTCSTDGNGCLFVSSTTPCTSAPANATASCSNGTCGFTCNPGYVLDQAGTGCDATYGPIAAKAGMACAIRGDNALWCWGGSNTGDGTTTTRWAPVRIAAGPWTKVSVYGAAYAIRGDGTLWAWGYNGDGRLGLGHTRNELVPTQVGSDTDWTDIAAGGDHACAVKKAGTLWCWGNSGTTFPSQLTLPAQVGTLTTWANVYGGSLFTCAKQTNGSLWCWGDNTYGEVGAGTTNTTEPAPKQVFGNVTTWASVSASLDHVCATRTDGSMWCWGNNANMELGETNPPTTSSNIPVQVGTAKTWMTASAGDIHSCGLQTDGSMWCWGDNSTGEFGNGTTGVSAVPVKNTTPGWASVSAGQSITCATSKTGHGFCWGEGGSWLGNFRGSVTPIAVSACSEGTSTCDPNAICDYQTGAGVTCACKPGFAGNGQVCGDIDECQAGTAACSAQATCANTTGSYTCTCNGSTVGDGLDCDAPFAKIFASDTATFGIRSDGSLWGWGPNTNGSLGDGTTTARSAPVHVGSSTWKKAVSHNSASMGIRSDGTLWGWGYNQDGRLGVGDTLQHPVPTQVGTDTDWVDVALGADHACAVKKAGSLWCWGQPNATTFTSQRLVPSQVAAVTTWASVTGGDYFMCGKQSNGSLWCWGDNSVGQVGAGSSAGTLQNPTQVFGGVTTWTTVQAGEQNACALRSDGTLWCWGSNSNGQLGRATPASSNLPVQVGTNTNWASLGVGWTHVCATQADGSLWCWGDGGNGALGDGSQIGATSPIRSGFVVGNDAPVSDGHVTSDYVAVASGYEYSCALRSNLTVRCWGQGSGFLGEGTGAQSNVSLQTAGNPCSTGPNPCDPNAVCTYTQSGGPACQCATGYVGNGFTCADDNECTDGTAICSPLATCTNTTGNYSCACNNPDVGNGVSCGTPYAYVAAGSAHACGVKSADQSLWCWGNNGNGNVGDGNSGNTVTAPEAIGTAKWRKVVAHYYNTYGIQTNGTLWAWGYNYQGMLGVGDTNDRHSPTQVGTATSWLDIAAGYDHACGIQSNGTLWCWGAPTANTSANEVNSPQQVGTLTTWLRVVSGDSTTCALQSPGTIWCWGDNSQGQLGTGSSAGSNATPAQIFGSVSTWSTIMTGGSQHFCAVKGDGTLWCWGANGSGQLAKNPSTTTNSNIPVQVGTASNWGVAAAGSDFTCATNTSGALYCWGDNGNGQFGDGSAISTFTPKQVGYIGGYNAPLEVGHVYTGWSLGIGSAGGAFLCANLSSNNSTWCWGNASLANVSQPSVATQLVP